MAARTTTRVTRSSPAAKPARRTDKAPRKAPARVAATPAPPMMTMTACPFVGRSAELAELRERLAVAAAVFLYGGAAVGKSRLLRELADSVDAPVALVRVGQGDTADALVARAERALGCLPGTLRATLTEASRLLIIDEAHGLGDDQLTQLWLAIAPGPTALGRVIIAGRERRLIGVGDGVAEQWLQPLDAVAARELWRSVAGDVAPHDGEAPGGGWPWAIRRAAASARLGIDAWELATLTADARAALEVLALAEAPLPPPLLAAFVIGKARPAAGVSELLARQLVDVTADGQLELVAPMRGVAIAALSPELATLVHRRFAALHADDAGADVDLVLARAALSTVAPPERLRLAVRHALAAGDEAGARTQLLAAAPGSRGRGARGELVAIIGLLAEPMHPALVPLRIELALEGGFVAEAAELAASVPGSVPALRRAEVALAAGDLDGARRALDGVDAAARADDDAGWRALRAELALARGELAEAASAVLAEARPSGADVSRARLLLARATVELFTGDVGAARATLGRAAAQGAASASLPPALRARIECQRAACLVLEGRLTEAAAAATAAAAQAHAVADVAVADELRLAHARIARRRGDAAGAIDELRALTAGRRARGDELGALRTELELAEALVERGEVVAAMELASVVQAASTRLGLGALAARARLCVAAVAVLEARFDAARTALGQLLADDALDAASRGRAQVLAAEIDAATTRSPGAVAVARAAGAVELRDDIDRALCGAHVAMAAGEFQLGLELAREVAAAAERSGRRSELASALVLTARLELARGDHGSARAAATRGVREAVRAGATRARVHGLLALAALARDEGQPEAAVAYARDASDLATSAGLPVERLTASAALDGLAGADILADPSSPSAATMAPPAIEAAARLLADLGLTAQRPFRVVDADGGTSDVADASPELLRMAARSLAVDGVRESLWRRGDELVDLRRRSLLKRLLFLFAAAPGKSFSKEEIVQSVWNVEYHPLRHDAALFTNIMRIRRLLGEDGAEIIRITDDGYRFTPPKDYIFVQPR
jgi:hypothetical protein